MLKLADWRKKERFFIIPSDILALAVIALVLGSVYYANRQAGENFSRDLRLETAEQLADSAEKFGADLKENIKLVEGLSLAIALEPDIQEDRFQRLTSKLLQTRSAIKSIALARDLKITMSSPLDGNHEDIGLDYRDQPGQLAVIQKALLTRAPAVDGPISMGRDLSGLLAYYPLYDGNDNNAWALLSAVIDLRDLLSKQSIAREHTELNIGLAKNASDGSIADILVGQEAFFEADPVTQPIYLANTQWTVAAAPKAGWNEPFALSWPRQLLISVIALIIIAAVVGIAHLMRVRHRNLITVQRLSKRMQLALDASKIGVWELNVDKREAIWDRRMYALYGKAPGSTQNPFHIWAERVHPDDFQKERTKLQIAIAEEKDFRSSFRIVLDDDSVHFIEVLGSCYKDPLGRTYLIGVNRDITNDVELQENLKRANVEARHKNMALEEAQNVLRYNALHDALTGLTNRRYLSETFVENGNGQHEDLVEPPYAIMHIDLDRFKEVNDTLGHAAGDAILRHSANMLKAIAGPRDALARVGGDEFSLITHWDGEIEQLTRIAQEIMRAIGKPFQYGEHTVRVSASVGISWLDEDTANVREALVNASIALYEAKRMGRNQFALFDETLRNIAITTKKVADELLLAVENDEFEVYYQPQISAKTMELEGIEALVRWQHPNRGLLAPSHFIGTAETTGSIARIDAIVLQKAAAQFKTWQQQGLHIPHISVNISAQRLMDPALLNGITQSELDPGQLCIELLESISFDDQDTGLEDAVSSIKALGVDVEIDDFGTGYASILSLLALEPRRLKIDRQLIFPITTGQSPRRLVASIIDIGKALGIEVVAEGVETAEHVRILRELGVDTFQGYFFAAPLLAEELVQFARDRPWLSKLS